MNELNQHSREYRMSLDYICFILSLFKVRNLLVKEKSPHFVLGIVRRFFHNNICIFTDIEKDGETISKDFGKSVKTYNSEGVHAVIFPFSLETEEDCVDKFSNSLKEINSEFVVVAFRNPFSYKLFLGRGTKETLSPWRVRAILGKNNYRIVEEKGGLHLKYILYSSAALIFEKIGQSSMHFRFVDRASNTWLTDNYLLRTLSYIQIIIARKGDR